MSAAVDIPQEHAPAGDDVGEVSLADADFRFLADLIGRHSGIVIGDHKRSLVCSRLRKRLRHHGLASFSAYCRLLESTPDELDEFVNALTTNLTAFFREAHHFDWLRRTLADEHGPGGRERIRIWSAGCSTGEEPYSIAMTVADALPAGRDVRILATDIDSRVVETARRGVYPEERVRGLESPVRERWFQRGRGAQAGHVRVRRELGEMIAFRQLNLLEAWPMRGPFDLIVCRNVVIYFDKPTQRRLFDRFADLLAPDGHLVVGHSETLYRVSDRFRSLGQTIYRKTR